MPDLERRHVIAGLGSLLALGAQAQTPARLQSCPLVTPSRTGIHDVAPVRWRCPRAAPSTSP